MAPKGRHGRLLLDEFDFSTDTMSASLEIGVEAVAANAWQSAAALAQPGVSGAKLKVSGYYTGAAAGTVYGEMRERMGSEAPAWCAWLVDTRTLGQPADVMRTAWVSDLPLEAPIKELLTLSATFEGVPFAGYTLLDGEVTATDDGTVVTLPAAGTAGGTAFLFVRDIDGEATDATVSIECDTIVGMTTPTDKGSIEFSAVGVYELALTGTVEQYVRVTIDDLGGADGFTAALILCVDGVTQ